MSVATGILFARVGIGANYYDSQPLIRMYTDRFITQAIDNGITYGDVDIGSVYEAGIKVVAATVNYNLFIHHGHGDIVTLIGDYIGTSYSEVMSKSDADSLDLIDGRAIYSLSCQAGADLLESIVSGVSGRQALASAGYNGNYIYLRNYSAGIEDIYFIATIGPGFKFVESLIEDKEWSDCYDDTLTAFDEQIAIWETGAYSSDPWASTVISILETDKARLVKFGDNTWKLSGDISPSVGTINVTTNNSGAGFTLTGSATYTGSGVTYTNATATPGEYTITYDAIDGFATPASETKTLIAGASITFTGTYTSASNTGTINVSCNISNTFTLTGPATYSSTGTTYSNASALPGLYTITFGDVTGYITPASQTRNLVIGGSITFTGTYIAEDEIPTPVPDTEPETVREPGLKITTIERTVQEV